MSNNPTVAINVTARELAILSAHVGYNSHYTTLRDKLSAAHEDMKQATRLKNREAKLARKERESRPA